MVFDKNYKNLPALALLLLFVAACYGLIIRYNFIYPLNGVVYKYILEGHSHVTFLGWGYLATVFLILTLYKEKIKNTGFYKLPLFIIFITVVLMLFSFALYGYGIFSIVLLVIFGLTSYIISIKLLNDVKKKETISNKLIRWGIFYYLLSSLATWFLPYVLITEGKTSLYYNTVYFYLHFLYNGFFVFSLFGLFFKILEKKTVKVNNSALNYFFIFLNIACIPTYFLSILWSNVNIFWNYVGGLAAILQLVSFFYLINVLKTHLFKRKLHSVSLKLLWFVIACYALKIVMQTASSIPYFVKWSIALKPFFIIGYLHLFTLGFMSVFLFLLLNEVLKTFNTKISQVGLLTFLGGVVITEVLLFYNGFSILYFKFQIPHYNYLMLIFSTLMVLGIGLILSQKLKAKNA